MHALYKECSTAQGFDIPRGASLDPFGQGTGGAAPRSGSDSSVAVVPKHDCSFLLGFRVSGTDDDRFAVRTSPFPSL